MMKMGILFLHLFVHISCHLVSFILSLLDENLLINAVFPLFQQANAHLSFGPLCAYLSINYLDRFLSAYELPVSKREKKNTKHASMPVLSTL